jgi:hypothetical protein
MTIPVLAWAMQRLIFGLVDRSQIRGNSAKQNKKSPVPLKRHGDFTELEIAQAYFLPALFAAQ